MDINGRHLKQIDVLDDTYGATAHSTIDREKGPMTSGSDPYAAGRTLVGKRMVPLTS